MRATSIVVCLLGVGLPACGSTEKAPAGPADAGAGTDGAGSDASGIVLDGGGGIPDAPNGASACPAGPCNYQTGTGCNVDFPSCIPVVSGGAVNPACQSAGKVAGGSACTTWDECAAGHVCAEGACRKLCCGGDWTGCPTGQNCARKLSVAVQGKPVPSGAYLCYPSDPCDPLVPTSCTKPGTQCLIVDPLGSTACFPPGPGGAGAACPCKGGFLCVADSCHRLCKAVEGGGEPSCQPGEGKCVHYDRDPPGVGECTG